MEQGFSWDDSSLKATGNTSAKLSQIAESNFFKAEVATYSEFSTRLLQYEMIDSYNSDIQWMVW